MEESREHAQRRRPLLPIECQSTAPCSGVVSLAGWMTGVESDAIVVSSKMVRWLLSCSMAWGVLVPKVSVIYSCDPNEQVSLPMPPWA